MSTLSRISEHLYVFEDTCLVYILVDGEHALVVDCGSGLVLAELEALGVQQIDWVLHTHHHRDQCQGDALLVEHGAALAVPEREVHLFEDVENFWANKPIMDNYYVGSDFFTLARSVPVTAILVDYSVFAWGPYTFQVVPAPGHTKGAVALLTEIDGATVAFTGDLITSPGRVWHVHDLQWYYGGGLGNAEGIQAVCISLVELLRAGPDVLLPSHGEVMYDPKTAIHQLLGGLRDLYRWIETSAWTPRAVGLVSDRHLDQISDHLWMNRYSLAHSYTLIADSGAGLFLDYGFPSLSHFRCDFRFVEHSLPELFARAGLRHVDLFIPSHYHDDHIAGVPLLQEKYGVRVWAHEVMSDLLRHPHAYSLPCLLPKPLEVERELREGETFDWQGFRFEIAHTPGHTYHHAALFAQIDGLRVALSGDTVYAGVFGPMLGGPIYRNRFRLDDFQKGIERLREWEPDLLLTGHSGAVQVDRAWLDSAWQRGRELTDRLYSIIAVPEEAGFALDPTWASIYPYQMEVVPGEQVGVSVKLRNYASSTIAAHVTLSVPDGWAYDPLHRVVEIEGRAEGEVHFALHVPTGVSYDSHVICADVSLDDGTCLRRFGQVAEGLIRILYGGETPYGAG